MKLTTFFLSMLFLHVGISAQAVPNFSGEWVLDPERSDVAGTNLVMRTIKVFQSPTEFRIDRVETTKNASGKDDTRTYSSNLRFGKVTNVNVPGAAQPLETGIRFDTSAGLTRLFIIAMVGLTTVSEEYWSLTDDGKDLYIVEVAPTVRLRRDLMFYRKGDSPRQPTPAIGGTWILNTKRSTRAPGAKMYRAMQMQVIYTWKRFAFRQDVVFDPTGPTEFKSPLMVDIPTSGKVDKMPGGERRFSVGLPGDRVFFDVIETAPPKTYQRTSFELEAGGKVLKVSRGIIGGKPVEVLYFDRK